jgi:hypothetical protein
MLGQLLIINVQNCSKEVFHFTDSIETSGENLHGCYATGHDKLNRVVVGVKRVNGP